MYSRPIVKDDFEVPKELVTKNFILNPLSVKHLNSDYEAVMKSENHLYKLMDDSDWPCLLYTSPSPRDGLLSRMASSA